MQVPDTMRKSVVFLYYRRGGDLIPAGTAFFGGFPIPEFPDRTATFLMTAHHVVAGIRASSDDGKVLLRLNTHQGSAVWADASVDQWLHLDTAVDCALLGWSPPTEMNVDYRIWDLNGSVTEATMIEQGISLGEEVFVVGLFRNHLGRDRNEPIVRVGNIAALPADPIRTKYYGDMRAILIESRSIGGLSGSPVFVHLGFSRWREGHVMQWTPTDPENATGPFQFLGLMHGHWDALETEVDAGNGEANNEKLNMGIGIVVPATEILRVLQPLQEEAAKLRKKMIEEGTAPTQDSTMDEESEFERFEKLARQVINTPKPEAADDSQEKSS